MLRVLLSIFLFSAAYGETYYVSTSGGDGSGANGSISLPWATMAYAYSHTKAGDVILLRRGDSWNQTVSANGWTDRSFGAYGTGERPLISAVTSESGSNGWTDEGAGIHSKTWPHHPERIWLNGVELIQKAKTWGTTLDQTYRWRFDYNYSWSGSPAKLSIFDPSGGFTNSTISFAWGRLDYALDLNGCSRLRFTSIEFAGGGTCVNWSSSSNCRFDSCSIGWSAGMYAIRQDGASSFDTLSNCIVDRGDVLPHMERSGYLIDVPSTEGADNIMLRMSDHWLITHCRIANFGHCGINLYGQINTNNGFSRFHVISWNEFYQAPDNDFGGAFQVQAENSTSANNNLFEYNYVHRVHDAGQLGGGRDNLFQFNVIDTVLYTPWKPDQSTGSGVGFGGYQASINNMWTNNIIMHAEGAAWTERGSAVDNSKTQSGNTVSNNIWYANGTVKTPGTNGQNNLTDAEWWSYGAIGNAISYVNNNVFNPRSSTPINRDNQRYAVADWGSHLPSGSTAGGNYSVDPQFKGGQGMDRYTVQNANVLKYFKNFDLRGVGVQSGSSSHDTTTSSGSGATMLYVNFPNPFKKSTTIQYSLPELSRVRLTVYDVLGRMVVRLVDGYQDRGVYDVRFDGSGSASGVYYYVLHTGVFDQARVMMYLH